MATVAVAATVGLVASSCGHGTRARALPVVTTTLPPSTLPPTTTPALTFPLTGITTTDAGRANRPALSVKVDNAPQALPQDGLNGADIVTEELVEGGLTRLFVTFQSADVSPVGPIRSARPVDADLLAELGGGIFAYSGAAAGEIAPSRAHSGAVLLSPENGNGGFYRVRNRAAPSNMYSSTAALYQEAARVKPGALPAAPALFTYSPTPSAGGAPGTHASIGFSQFSSAAWAWDPANNVYTRTQNGAPDNQADGAPVTAQDIVILSVGIGHTGIFDQARNEDPLVIVTGSGPAWVLRDGQVFKGTWQRDSYSVPMKLVGADGQVMPLHPGRTWMELQPNGMGQPTIS